jgi:hypothetical protein
MSETASSDEDSDPWKDCCQPECKFRHLREDWDWCDCGQRVPPCIEDNYCSHCFGTYCEDCRHVCSCCGVTLCSACRFQESFSCGLPEQLDDWFATRLNLTRWEWVPYNPTTNKAVPVVLPLINNGSVLGEMGRNHSHFYCMCGCNQSFCCDVNPLLLTQPILSVENRCKALLPNRPSKTLCSNLRVSVEALQRWMAHKRRKSRWIVTTLYERSCYEVHRKRNRSCKTLVKFLPYDVVVDCKACSDIWFRTASSYYVSIWEPIVVQGRVSLETLQPPTTK